MEIFIAAGALAVTIVTSLILLTWFISNQFSDTRSKFYTAIEKLEDKITDAMKDHENKDQSRFLSLEEQIKQIQLRNATFDAIQKRKHNNETVPDRH